MRQGLVSQDIAAGNASFVEVFSHEALIGAEPASPAAEIRMADRLLP
jgi:hypothetical protein